jgi:hypothetical protein
MKCILFVLVIKRRYLCAIEGVAQHCFPFEKMLLLCIRLGSTAMFYFLVSNKGNVT